MSNKLAKISLSSLTLGIYICKVKINNTDIIEWLWDFKGIIPLL